jgi:membrane protease YdiL (CAAX protease family)
MFTAPDGRLQPIWAFVFSALLSVAAFLIAGYASGAIAGEHVLRFEAVFRPLLVVLLLAIFSWLLSVGSHIEEHRIAAQGLPFLPGWPRQFALGCGIGLLLVILAVVPVAIWGNVSFRTTVSPFNVGRAVIVLGVLIAAALAEELMFRGYPFQRLVEGIGATGAIIVFSVLFGVVHLSNPGESLWGLINTVAIGILLAIAYLRTKALWLPWGIHFAWNAVLGLLLGLPVSGLRLFNVAVHGTAIGPKWLTGGSYGIEASAPGALAIVAGLILIWKLPLSQIQRPSSLSRGGDRVEPSLPNVTN